MCRFEKYVDYALDVPMYFAYRNKQYVNCAGMSFRVCSMPPPLWYQTPYSSIFNISKCVIKQDFLNGKLPNLPGDIATIGDWENHLTTIFPEVVLLKEMPAAIFICGNTGDLFKGVIGLSR